MAKPTTTTIRPRCPDCGHKIRGKNHKEGDAHDRGVMRRMNRKVAAAT